MRQKKYKLKCLEEIGKDKVRITFVLLALVATEIQTERLLNSLCDLDSSGIQKVCIKCIFHKIYANISKFSQH